MNKDWKKTHIIYWHDELHDDFDQILSKRPPLKPGYNFIRNNHFANFFGNILYYGIALPILAVFSYLTGMKVKGRKNLKAVKKTGAIIYSNHVSVPDTYKMASPVCFGKRVNILGYTDSLTVPVLKNVVRQLGFLPLPLGPDPENKAALIEAMRYYVHKKHQFVLIYPEAHIWPYYTKIRNFKVQTMKYPAILDAPVLPIVTCWRKVWWCKRPKQTVKIGTAIWPKLELTQDENIQYLYDECLSQMRALSESEKQFEYIKYIKVEK
ncbi:MAG: 1-acyl-sn-glycerol-3-phosphate acyltransferase [Firmicutes bacterium]|nr:1-acyl-sn-glycerol-3-phosphate acyltransferase [Candidatus Fiminaster equi]